MKIAIVGPAYPYRGGIASYNERLAKELQVDGHEVTIYTFTLQYPDILFPGKSQYVDGSEPEDITIKRSINSINPLSWERAGRCIKKERPDILIVRYWLPFMAPSLGRVCRVARSNKHTKVICLADNIVPHEKRIGDKTLTQYFMNSIDGIVAMSQSVLDDAKTFKAKLPQALCPHPLFDNYGEKTSMPNAKKSLELQQDTNYLLFFGIIREYKGFDLIIKAMADERVRKLPVKLIVAGEYYAKPEPYMELIEKLDVGDDIILHNEFIPEKDVTLYFGACDMVVQPYKSATQSGVTQVGYHFEKPMLVTNVGGLAEIIPDKVVGYVTEPNPEEIADAIVDFYDGSKKEAFEKNVVEEKKRFSWERMVETFINTAEKISKPL
ncbi:MAG: glycosyltransferase [Bacteroidales bacterium]